jgi:hypothetical protein
MKPLPTGTIRSNIATWAVPAQHLPAVAHFLHDVLPNEVYDPHFRGQVLRTTYFDTSNFDLRKARQAAGRYLTLRLRCYQPPEGEQEVYALSAKTEQEKWRQEISADLAEQIASGWLLDWPAQVLPGPLVDRLQELIVPNGGTADLAGVLVGVVTVCCRRYAVEDDQDRFTLDTEVNTDTGLALPFAVLEFKSTDAEAIVPQAGALDPIRLRPVKLSKFLWATSAGK